MKKSILFVFIVLGMVLTSCQKIEESPISRSGVKEAPVTVETNINGLTNEQLNIQQRLKEDNLPGAVKHLYILSAYSGQVIMYSTVKGKVTSSGKRLTPTTLSIVSQGYEKYHPDMIQDDGTYGSSVEYIYWFDSKGIYHQQYITGGMIVHVSSQPIAVKSVTLNLELQKGE